MRWLGATLAGALLSLGAPASAKTDPIAELPPYTAAYQPRTVDERGVWMMADEGERLLRDSKFLVNDPGLNHYVLGVLCKTVGDSRCGGVRLYIVRTAAFNAAMAPNGMLVVNTGLLLRMRNEAELAAVLGHEFAHFEMRHSLNGFKQQRTATDIFAWMGVAAAGAAYYGGGYGSVRSYQSAQIGAIGSIYANDRAQETQADLLSMAYLKTSPYDPGCFADIWERIMGEADATARGRKQRIARYDRVSFFASHPTELARAQYLRDIALKMNKGGEDGSQRFRDAMAKWRGDFLLDQIKLNDFEGTDFLMGQLAANQWTPDLLYSRAELYRARGNPRDLVSAISFYRQALEGDHNNAEAYRGLGLAQLRNRDPSGVEALKTYLAMRPDASDRAMISTLLQ